MALEPNTTKAKVLAAACGLNLPQINTQINSENNANQHIPINLSENSDDSFQYDSDPEEYRDDNIAWYNQEEDLHDREGFEALGESYVLDDVSDLEEREQEESSIDHEELSVK